MGIVSKFEKTGLTFELIFETLGRWKCDENGKMYGKGMNAARQRLQRFRESGMKYE